LRPIISIVGRSHSGKTTLLELVITELKRRGYRIVVLKHSGEDFEPDTAGKDTWRFRQAGSEMVAISTASKLVTIKPLERDISPQEFSRTVTGNYDLILTEGFKQASTHKIEVHRREQGSDLVSNSKQLLAVVTDEPLPVKVPQFHKDETSRVADLIEQYILDWRREENVELYVNDAFINLNEFAKKILASTLAGAVSSLKGIGQVKSVRIGLRRKD